MKKTAAPASADAYVAALSGWRSKLVRHLRTETQAAVKFEETIKWGHIVYFANGPVLLIRAEDERVLFGFWRGQRLMSIEPRLKPGGKYEMATVSLEKNDTIDAKTIRRLAREGAKLNRVLGNPQLAAGSRR